MSEIIALLAFEIDMKERLIEVGKYPTLGNSWRITLQELLYES